MLNHKSQNNRVLRLTGPQVEKQKKSKRDLGEMSSKYKTIAGFMPRAQTAGRITLLTEGHQIRVLGSFALILCCNDSLKIWYFDEF